MLRNLNEIKEIEFEKINSEEQFKKALQISEEEWEQIIKYSQSSTDENTPKGSEDIRIQLEIVNEYGEDDTLNMDLVYNTINDEFDEEIGRTFDLGELNHVVVYY